MLSTLQRFDHSASVATICTALRLDGAVILTSAVDVALADTVAAQLRPHFDAEGLKFRNDFNGYKTRRLAAVLAQSRAAADLIAHARLLEVIDEVLLPHCTNYRIGSTTAIEIEPGEGAQQLHTDGEIYPIRMPGVEWQVSAMWALDDFTSENGATRVQPGSHRWPGESGYRQDIESVEAIMPKGSVLIYLGSVVHGGGANRSSKARAGLINTYALGWLRQEVNQYLTIPRDIMDSYPDKLRRLMGYQAHGQMLGKFPSEPDGFWENN